MIGKLRKLKGRSFDELRERAAQALSAQLEFRGVAGPKGELDDRAFGALLAPGVASPGASQAEMLHQHFKARPSPGLFAGIRDGSTRAEFAGAEWQHARTAAIAAAERALKGNFQLLGYPQLDFGQPINWHLDPVSGIVAPRVHWSRIPYLNAAIVGDHKVTWELNRHQHFYTLGRAFQATGNEAYARCFAAHIESWMDANPPKIGINWASSLEVAYRSISWMWALELFRESTALTPALLSRILKYAYVHALHLERYLSTYFSPNTHLTGEALGLLYLGTCLPEFAESSRWRERGWRILEKETTRQVHADGVYFEQTTYYHRYTLDIYLHAVLLARSNGFVVPEAMLDRLRLLGTCLADMTNAAGATPLIGDDDGGRLVILEERAFDDVRASLSIASVVLASPAIGAVAGTPTEEVLWTLGVNGVEVARRNASSAKPSHLSRLYPTGGYAVLRDGWEKENMVAVMDCAPLGTMNCGHAHADTLSTEFSVDGCDLLIDPGTFSYTTSVEERALFRHTAMHNTVTVDGHASSVPTGPFSWSVRTDAAVDSWWTGNLTHCVVAHHNGFERLPTPFRHTRTVLFSPRKYWVIIDTLSGTGECEVVAHWHAAVGTTLQDNGPRQTRIERTSGEYRAAALVAAAGDVDSFEWNDGWVSRAYGERTLAPVGTIHSKRNGARTLITVVCPLRDEPVAVNALSTQSGYGVEIQSGSSNDIVLVGGIDGVAAVGEFQLRGRLAVVRRESANAIPTAFALFGEDATLRMSGAVARTTDVLEGAFANGAWKTFGRGVVSG